MKQLDMSVEIWEQGSGYDGLIRQIERCAGISKDPSGDEVIARDFSSDDLEHGTVYLRAYFNNEIVDKYKDNPHTRVIIPESKYDPFAYITTNYRVLSENKWLSDLDFQIEPEKQHELRVCVYFKSSGKVQTKFLSEWVESFDTIDGLEQLFRERKLIK